MIKGFDEVYCNEPPPVPDAQSVLFAVRSWRGWVSLHALRKQYYINVKRYPHHVESLKRLDQFLLELVKGGRLVRCNSFEVIGWDERRVAGAQEFYTPSERVVSRQ